jgi:hypothetical protein
MTMTMTMTMRIAKPQIVAIFWAAITGLLMWVLADPQKLVQLRNAMIADSAPETSFHWIPLEKPDWFEHESTSVPAYFDAEVSRHSLRHSDPWESSMKIAKHLRSKPKVKGPIKGTTVKAYVGIVQQGRGYCADTLRSLMGWVTLPTYSSENGGCRSVTSVAMVTHLMRFIYLNLEPGHSLIH